MTTTDTVHEGPPPTDRGRWWWLFLVLGAMPLVIWWLSWFPGMLSSDSIRQLVRVDAADFTNEVPAIHSIAVWLITRIWDSPAAVTLVQVALMIALMAAYLRRSPALGIPWWLAGAFVLAFGWLPAVGATTIALEPQVAQTLVGLWILIELMALAPEPRDYLSDPWSIARLTVATGLAWLLDHAGLVVVAVVFGVLAVGLRRSIKLIAVPLAGAIALVLLVQGPVYAAFSVDREVTPIGEAYAPEIAAVYHHHPGWFGNDDLALLTAVAELEVWDAAYVCGDGKSLIEDRDFDISVIRSNPGAYRGLLFRSAAANPMTVAGHRACAAGAFLIPGQPLGERFATYVYNVPPNDLGVVRDSQWEPGFNVTKAILVRVDQPQRLWMYWRPALLVWPAIGAIAALTVRRRRLPTTAIPLLGYLLLAVLTVREPSFRESFPVYAIAFLTLPMWCLVFHGVRGDGGGSERSDEGPVNGSV